MIRSQKQIFIMGKFIICLTVTMMLGSFGNYGSHWMTTKKTMNRMDLAEQRFFITNKMRNKLIHIKHGNRKGRIGLSAASWNCCRGLLNKYNHPTDKVDSIASFLKEANIVVLAVSESGLHGTRLRTQRSFPLNEMNINNSLRIQGYKIVLPESRVMV